MTEIFSHWKISRAVDALKCPLGGANPRMIWRRRRRRRRSWFDWCDGGNFRRRRENTPAHRNHYSGGENTECAPRNFGKSCFSREKNSTEFSYVIFASSSFLQQQLRPITIRSSTQLCDGIKSQSHQVETLRDPELEADFLMFSYALLQ